MPRLFFQLSYMRAYPAKTGTRQENKHISQVREQDKWEDKIAANVLLPLQASVFVLFECCFQEVACRGSVTHDQKLNMT